MSGTSSGTYTWAVSDVHGCSKLGTSSGAYAWAVSSIHGYSAAGTSSAAYTWAATGPVGHRASVGTSSGRYNWRYRIIYHGMKSVVPVDTIGFYDRFRFIIEDVHGNILARDVIAAEVSVSKILSGPSQITFKIHHNEPSIQKSDGTGPIQLKPWAHWIHAEKQMIDGTDKIVASGIMKPSTVDPATGVLSLEAEGFSNYPKGIPWLENWNPYSVDPFEVFARIWTHIQSYDNAQMGVTVYPTDSGTMMLPGFGFENEVFVANFFALFIREVDRIDCGDFLNKLSRDIPIDYIEESSWNAGRTAISKGIKLAYPKGGVIQEGLAFRIQENVLEATQKTEVEIDWASDISIKGWFPYREYSYQFTNADQDRYRRVIDEVDAKINSYERARAWAHRKLTRRQTPHYYEEILIDPYHPNAPFGTFDVGDTIWVQGPMAWVGNNITQDHRILGWTFSEPDARMQLKLMAEGAFNYDPIYYME